MPKAYYNGIETEVPDPEDIAASFQALEDATIEAKQAPTAEITPKTTGYTPKGISDRKTVILKCISPGCMFEKKREPFLYFSMNMMELVQRTYRCPAHAERVPNVSM